MAQPAFKHNGRKNRSYAAICEAFGLLPMSINDIAQRTGITHETLVGWMTAAEAIRMVHLSDVIGDGRSCDRVFTLGECSGTPLKWTGRKRITVLRPGERLVTLALFWRELEHPAPVPELAMRSGICQRTVNDLVLVMRENAMARVVDWDQSQSPPVAVWGKGPGADARRPKKLGRAVSRRISNAKYWAGRRERLKQQQLLMALGFAANQPMAQAA